MRFAQLVRPSAATMETGRGSLVVEMLDARARLTAEPGADCEALAHVLELVLGRVAL